MMLELSTGTPKTDARKLKTGFLRILNNSVSDVVSVETADSFAAQITLRYHLNFVGDNPEEWFNVENYVQFLAERTRSIIRRAAKEHTVQEIRDKAIDIVRTLILGAPVEGAGRPGRVFDENGMVIFDLDVETPVIQGDIDRLLRQTEQDTLRQIPALTHPRSRGGESPLREERDTVGETQNSPAGPKSQMGRRCMPAGQSPSGVIHKQLPNDLLAEEDNLCPGRPGAVDNIPIITASNATTRDDLPRPIMVLEQPPKEQRRKMTTNEHYASRNA